jgi:2-polyprenyl-3-methyl-5-hydroxy-6-metoxy-1,4-benzoquinol methylase
VNRAAPTNINGPLYWDGIYQIEELGAKVRVDETRRLALERWIRIRELELQREASILDVGCGLGDALLWLRQNRQDRRCTGIDIAPGVIERNQRLHSPEFTWRCVDAQVLDTVWVDRPFDVVWCGETLEHLDDPDKAVAGMATICGHGGFLILSTPFKQRNTSPEHVWEFDPADITRWAAQYGDLVFLDCALLQSWLTMFAVIRVGGGT